MDIDLFYKIKDWALEGDMDGFDTLAAEEIGWKPYVVADPWYDDQVGDFDYMSLLKGGAGMLSGAGGMMSGGQAGAPAAGTPAAAETLRLQAAQLQAESSARTWKIVGGIALGVLGLGAVALVARPAKTVP